MQITEKKLSAGDWVEVRSKEEILRTLDKDGRLEGMPFMPEMFEYCGKTFQVFKRAHKTCDTVFPIRGRRVDRTVHLETRCDGKAHGGCQAGCLIFWKHEWLKPSTREAASKVRIDVPTRAKGSETASTGVGGESLVWQRTQRQVADSDAPLYVCQATQLPYATTDLEWWDISQYLEDLWSGNIGIQRLLGGFAYSAYYHLSQAGIGLGRPMRWLYDKLHPLWGGTRFPRTAGRIPVGQPTPTASIGLQAGDLVRVKRHEEILETITTDNINRGMYWDAELVPYCGKTYRVLKRVTQIIDEKSGRMLEMKNPCIILESVVCQARYSSCRMFCPRSIYPYWREIWLERVTEATPTARESVSRQL